MPVVLLSTTGRTMENIQFNEDEIRALSANLGIRVKKLPLSG
jgi:hypothetical protein